MPTYKCPNCKEQNISLKNKYRAAYWFTLVCDNCGKKLCANPILLGLIDMAYVWNIMWFVSLSHFHKDFSWLIYIIPTWLVLDFISISCIPLSTLAKK